jgi:hypothetical protein
MRCSVQVACVLSMIATQASVVRTQQVTLGAQAQTNAGVRSKGLPRSRFVRHGAGAQQRCQLHRLGK